MIFASVPRCAIYTKPFTEFIKNLERLSGADWSRMFNICFVVIIVEELSTKIEKY